MNPPEVEKWLLGKLQTRMLLFTCSLSMLADNYDISGDIFNKQKPTLRDESVTVLQ